MENGNSGNHLLLTRETLDVGAINALATVNSCGAISLFVGTTRDNFEDKKVVTLEYEAYEPMAKKEMQTICDELRRRWPDIANIVIHHRIGLVPVGQASVVIAISSPHRAASLEAVAMAIEELKRRVPIWKKEKYEGDESAWKENKESNTKNGFDERYCNIQDNHTLPTQFVQISATEREINRRIQCFVEKKREEIDLNNIIDYARPAMDVELSNIGKENDENMPLTCARTNSTIIKQESSKGHLKVYHTQNFVGPQVRHSYMHTSDTAYAGQLDVKSIIKNDPTSENNSVKADKTSTTHAILERMQTIEEHLNMRDDTKKDVVKRLKALEERILHLESISPEYRHFLFDKTHQDINPYNFLENSNQETKHNPHMNCNNHKVYDVGDINSIIEEMS